MIHLIRVCLLYFLPWQILLNFDPLFLRNCDRITGEYQIEVKMYYGLLKHRDAFSPT